MRRHWRISFVGAFAAIVTFGGCDRISISKIQLIPTSVARRESTTSAESESSSPVDPETAAVLEKSTQPVKNDARSEAQNAEPDADSVVSPRTPDATTSVSENSTSTAGQSQQPDLTTLIENVERAVVRVEVRTTSGTGHGSGFVISNDGLIVTNFHVIEDATSATAAFSNGARLSVEGVVGHDEDRDIAIIKVTAPAPLHHISLNTTLPKKGEPVLTFGSPLEFDFSVTHGMISAVRDDVALGAIRRPGTWIQTSAPLSPGNSGGPLVDYEGNVIGANTWSRVGGENLNFAISARDIASCLKSAAESKIQSFSEFAASRPQRTFGQVKRPDNPGASDPLLEKLHGCLKQIVEKRRQREEELKAAREEIEQHKARLKAAILAGDYVEIARVRGQLRNDRENVDRLIETRLRFDRLDIHRLASGQVGTLNGITLSVLQVIDPSSGQFLGIPELTGVPSGRRILCFNWLDLSSTVDGDRIRCNDELVFAVMGTRTYPTIAGDSNTVFNLYAVLHMSQLRETLEVYRVSEADLEPVFTPEEQARGDAVLAEERRRREVFIAEQQRDMRALKAAADLRLAQNLLNRNKVTAAVERMQDVVRSYPETASARKARAILMNLGADVPGIEDEDK